MHTQRLGHGEPADQSDGGVAEPGGTTADQGDAPGAGDLELLLADGHRDSEAGVDAAEVLADDRAEQGGRCGDLQGGQGGGQGGDHPDPAQLLPAPATVG